MSKADTSKRSFLKKMAAAVGFVAAAGYVRKLISTRTDSMQAINDHNAADEHKQKQAWLHKQWQPMSASEKKQMLDAIINSHNKYQT
jgi:hypothetical protein